MKKIIYLGIAAAVIYYIVVKIKESKAVVEPVKPVRDKYVIDLTKQVAIKPQVVSGAVRFQEVVG